MKENLCNGLWIGQCEETLIRLHNGIQIYMQLISDNGLFVDYVTWSDACSLSNDGQISPVQIRQSADYPGAFEGLIDASSLVDICERSCRDEQWPLTEPLVTNSFWANISDTLYGKTAGYAFARHIGAFD